MRQSEAIVKLISLLLHLQSVNYRQAFDVAGNLHWNWPLIVDMTIFFLAV